LAIAALISAALNTTFVAGPLLAIPIDGGPPVTIDDGTLGPVTAQFDNSSLGVRSVADNQIFYLKGYSNSEVGFYVADLPGQTTLVGDFNKDGTVDAADYVVWRKGLGTTNTEDDYNDWKANFGATLGSGSFATASFESPESAVPEPSSFLPLVLAVTCVSERRCGP
jgi:hypothetical protein